MHESSIYKLKNGIKLVHVYIPNFPVALSSFWINKGSRNDPKGKDGLAHIFEHIFLTKTELISDRQKRLFEVEKRGWVFNAFTSLSTTNYFYIHSPNESNEAVNFLIDGYNTSIFDKNDIESEKQIIIDEEQRNKNNPESYIWRLSNTALWPKSGLGNLFFGNKKTLTSINKNDINNFYIKNYKPENTVFTVINSSSNIDIIKSNIENQIKSFDSPLEFIKENLGKKIDISFEERDIDFLQIALSFITVDGNDYRTSLILNLIKNYLASGWISRLIIRLRIENKLTYWVDSSKEEFVDTGLLRFILSVNPKDVFTVLKIFEEEIVLLKNILIDGDELNQHKNKYKGDIMRLGLDISYLNWWYSSSMVIFDRENQTPQQFLKDIDSITPEEIKDVANKYLKEENFSLAIIGREQRINNIPTFR